MPCCPHKEFIFCNLWSGVAGRCSHGGPYDGSRIATEGINKESNDKTWSPMRQLHDKSAVAALDNSQSYLSSGISSSH